MKLIGKTYWEFESTVLRDHIKKGKEKERNVFFNAAYQMIRLESLMIKQKSVLRKIDN